MSVNHVLIALHILVPRRRLIVRILLLGQPGGVAIKRLRNRFPEPFIAKHGVFVFILHNPYIVLDQTPTLESLSEGIWIRWNPHTKYLLRLLNPGHHHTHVHKSLTSAES